MTKLQARDADLHHEDGTHRWTPSTALGSLLDAHERRLRAHLADHTLARPATYALAEGESDVLIPIPDAPWYVLAHDKFLSGWGAAAGKRNVVVLVCSSREEAEVVAANAIAREEMAGVELLDHIPPQLDDVIYSLLTKDGGAARWYREGGFSR